MSRSANPEAHEALRVAECLRIALGRDGFTPADRASLTRSYADNVLKAVPALFPNASAAQLVEHERCVRKVLDVMLHGLPLSASPQTGKPMV